MCTLADLGQGFHLIAARDHCRIATGRKVPAGDWVAAERLIEWGTAPRGWTKGAARVWHNRYWRLHGNLERVAMVDEFLAARAVERARRNRDRRAKLAARKRDCALSVCDPMAVQSSRIVRDALNELRETSDSDSWNLKG